MQEAEKAVDPDARGGDGRGNDEKDATLQSATREDEERDSVGEKQRLEDWFDKKQNVGGAPKTHQTWYNTI